MKQKYLFPILGAIVLISILMAVLSLADSTPVSAAMAPRTTPVKIDVDLPSTSTNTPPTGTLALRIFAPATPAGARYPQGAPVVVYVQGGSGAGSLKTPLLGADDVIRIAFLFPGGTDLATGRSSDGTYDYRGPDSIAALRDVTLYAAGLLTDSDGHTIDDVVPVNVLHDNIGFYGSSNGGNISVVTADLFGADLNGYLKYIVQWESPVSSQMAVVDLGPFREECTSPPKVTLPTENPWYDPTGYTPLTVTVDYSAIAFNTTTSSPLVYLDGNGDGSYTTVPDGANPGCFTPDLNGDGVLTTTEDVPLGSYDDGSRYYFSAPATKAMQDQGIFTSWPVTIANVSQANAWWGLREAVQHYAGAVSKNADLEGMVLASVGDHVQIASDKPHIHQAFDGWDDAGDWVKINPARSYAVAVNPALSSRTDLPDNAANTPPADWTDVTGYAFPDGLENDYAVAAVHEMADRAHAAGTPTATPTATATTPPAATATATSGPAPTPVKKETVSLNGLRGWSSALGNNIKVFDVAVDEARNRVYVQGILSPGIAVIDGNTDTLIGSVDIGLSYNSFHRTYLAVHPTNGMLYVADFHGSTLRSIDPATAVITGPVTLDGTPTFVLADSDYVYVSLQSLGKVAVYDATTLAKVQLVDLGTDRIGGMVLDHTNQKLYVTNAGAPVGNQSTLYVINTTTMTTSTPILFTNTTGQPTSFVDRDPATGNFFVTSEKYLFILSSSGNVLHTVPLPNKSKQPFYWGATGKVYITSHDGISPIHSSLEVVDAVTGHIDHIIDLQTGGAQRTALNKTTGKLYTNGMEYTNVPVVDLHTNTLIKRIDIGNSVEDIAVDPGSGVAYFANRLGGSTVMSYDAANDRWDEFATGGWPTAVDFDPGLGRLFVLSHFSGTVEAYDVGTHPLSPTLAGTASLGLHDITDALSNQTVDATRHRVVTTHPEHDSVVIVDGATLTVTATISDVPSFTFDPKTTAGPGHLQPAVDEVQNKLYVLDPKTKRVDVFDGNTGYAYLRTIDLAGYSWTWKNDFNDHLLWMDNARHRLYVGPLVIDTTTDTYAGILPAGSGEVVVGMDKANNLLYTLGVDPPSASTHQGAAPGSSRPTASQQRPPRSQGQSTAPGSSRPTASQQRPPRSQGQSTAPGSSRPTASTGRRPKPASSGTQTTQANQLYVIDRDTYAVQAQAAMRDVSYVPPFAAVDPVHARFFAGYMQPAEVDVYSLAGAGSGFTITLPVILKQGAGEPVPTPTPTATSVSLNRPENPQIGLNFIRFDWDESSYYQPSWIFNDFADLGVQTYRQFIKADLLWNVVEPQDNQWDWSTADAVIPNADFEPIVTLFALQYASATPPWATDPAEFQKTLGPEAQDYLQHIIDRYGPYVKYWEIGNEMDHWRAADPTPAATTQSKRSPRGLPPSYPLDGFSPQEQGAFFAQVADFIRARDPDAVIVMPGMGGLSDYTLNTWLAGVIEGGGTGWFDVINYHFYGPWYSFPNQRGQLATFIAGHGLTGKAVWNTETGSTASPTLTARTDYPNSPQSQAADVFRRLVQDYGYGDSLALWHTYIGSPDAPDNDWRLYGIRTDTAVAQPSYYSFKLLVGELIPFSNVDKLASSPGDENIYRFTTAGAATKYVVWGTGTFTVPAGMGQMTSVVPNADGSFTWQAVAPGQVLTLSDVPVLLK